MLTLTQLNLRHPSPPAIARRQPIPPMMTETLTLQRGTLTAVVGPNGAGKTTLFKLITGEQASVGKRDLHGRSLAEVDRGWRARHLGVLAQAHRLPFPLTARAVVELGLTPLRLSSRDAQAVVDSALQQTDTAHLAKRPWQRLSGGECQRVQLARVLVQLSQATEPPLLLLDEPTSAQDFSQQQRIFQHARQLADQGWMVMMITHDFNGVLRYADHVWLMDQGRVMHAAAPATVLTPVMIQRYWGLTPGVAHTADGQTLLY